MTGLEIIQCRDALKTGRAALEAHWDELSNLFMPFRLMNSNGIPDIQSSKNIFDSTGRRSALILANGLASLVTPREEVWFEFLAPRNLRGDDEAVKFYRAASETAREFIESSNFYEEIQEAYIESPVFGTAALFCGDLDERGELYFRHQPIKTYYITEDAHGWVNGFYRDLQLTADQAAEEFGEKELPEEVSKQVGKPEGKTTTHDFVHAVFYSEEKPAANAAASESMKWKNIVVHEKTKKVVESGGYNEFPFAVHRYRRFGRCVWGFGPGTLGASDATQLEFLNQLADVAAEKSVLPPIIAPSSLEGEIGQGALEITYVDPTDPNSAQILREWCTVGRYDVAKDRMDDKRAQLEKAFHVDLFQLFATRQAERGPLTATEASLVAGEKLTQFSPVFGRLVSEFLDPVLSRVFSVLLRSGQFGAPPASVTAILGGKRTGVAPPSVLYKNKIMMAMAARANGSLIEFTNLAMPLLQIYPEALDALNMPVMVRSAARNAGIPEEWLRGKREVETIQAQRAQAAQAQQQLATADAAAGVAQKVGSLPPDMQQKISQNMPPA